MNNTIILGIYPNFRGFGYAIFRDAKRPIVCGTVVVRPISNKETIERIEKLINYFKPAIIIYQKLDGKHSHKSKRVKSLLNRLEKMHADKYIKLVSYSRLEIRTVFEQFGASTKYDIAHVIARWLPEYQKKLPRYRKIWMTEGYYQGMFDAISLVLTHYYLNA